jgi:kinesin family protein 5
VNIKSISENNNYKFSFDRAFDFNTKQKEIYEFAAKNIIDSVFEGFNGTIFAYGQTSSGKTFTMQGVIDDPLLEGIIPRIIRYIFERIEVLSDKNLQFVVRVSILEIYNEKIRDLLETNKTNLQIREDKSRGIFIEDLSEYQIGSSNKVMDIMKKGLDNRAVNSTNMNEQSSRSHSIVILNIIQNNIKDLSAKVGKLYLVDLAGSEKISKTGAKGQVLDEAKSINKSLTTLGLVIKALTDSKQGHIPYRESKLTRVLQESLGGNSKTCLIITCSPSIYNEAETLSTLRFGMRAKKVKNKAKINKEFSIQELKCEVNKLEGQLGKFKNRIEILEDYLMQKGIPIPSDDLKINSFNKPIINGSLPNNKKNDPHKSTKNDILNRTIIHEEAIREINNQYIDVLNIVNSLENEKLELEIELTKLETELKIFI